MTKALFKISGMHCVSCSISIDGELEDTEGVHAANTNFAKAITEVEFDDKKLTHHKITSIIEKVGYTAQLLDK